MNKAGTVEQHVESSQFGSQVIHVAGVKNVEPAGANGRPIVAQGLQGGLVDIGGPYGRPFVRERESGRASNALGGCGHQRNFSGKSSAHLLFLLTVSGSAFFF